MNRFWFWLILAMSAVSIMLSCSVIKDQLDAKVCAKNPDAPRCN